MGLDEGLFRILMMIRGCGGKDAGLVARETVCRSSREIAFEDDGTMVSVLGEAPKLGDDGVKTN